MTTLVCPRHRAALAACLLVWTAPVHAGYTFSISASPTDPHVNQDEPAGELRQLHLWLVCADTDLAAFEGGVTTNLIVSGFTPTAGVLNIGNAGDLMLAVPGCPADTALRLGHWDVWDTGGIVCLEPSVANGTLSAVDCGALPAVTESPKVVGFSSSERPPCSRGRHPCASEPPMRELVIGYGQVLEPPYEFTGVGEDSLFVNGLLFAPIKGPDPDQGVAEPPPVDPQDGPGQRAATSRKGLHAPLIRLFNRFAETGGYVAFGHGYLCTASAHEARRARQLIEKMRRGEDVSDGELARSALDHRVLEAIRRADRQQGP